MAFLFCCFGSKAEERKIAEWKHQHSKEVKAARDEAADVEVYIRKECGLMYLETRPFRPGLNMKGRAGLSRESVQEADVEWTKSLEDNKLAMRFKRSGKWEPTPRKKVRVLGRLYNLLRIQA
jgi:hypothetical protein